MLVGTRSVNPIERSAFSLQREEGSSAIEFVLVYPLALGLIALSFTSSYVLQIRQLGVTLIAREVGRGIEIGFTPREISHSLKILCDDVGFAEEPQLVVHKTDEENALLTVSYKGESFSTRLNIKNASPLWKQIKSDLGSSLPLLIGLVGLVFAVVALATNLGAGCIAYIRANELASNLALSLAEANPAGLAEAADNLALEWPPDVRARVSYVVSSPDRRTSEVRLCYAYRPVWQWFGLDSQVACAERKARILQLNGG